MNDIKSFFSFSGVSTRSQYWATNLFCYMGLIASVLLGALLSMSGILGIMSGAVLMVVAVVVATWLVFAVTVRRCRDIGISPFFTLALLIPYMAIIPFIVFGCLSSEKKID